MSSALRIKPSNPPSHSRIPLHAIDQAPVLFTPLNLFFKPSSSSSSSGPTHLKHFAASLQDVIDRLPFIAGSIYTVYDPQGLKSKDLVDDGRGVDLIWVEHPTPYADLPESADLSPRSVLASQETTHHTLLMVKFTKFTCGTLAMCISLSHMFADCTSYVEVIKEWARVSRGASTTNEALTISSWQRTPQLFFPRPTPGAVPHGMRPPDSTPAPAAPLHPRPETACSFFFTWDALRTLKHACTPTDPAAWVSTGDCVGALLWRALTFARKPLLKPGRDVHLYMAVDGRSHSTVQPGASQYFGNLVTPITVTLSQSALLDNTLASVALSFRRAMVDQLTQSNCANMLSLFSLVNTIPRVCDTALGDSRISNWTKYPLVGEALDFGGGPPIWESTGVFPAGQMLILPQREGYLGSVTVEVEWASKLTAGEEILKYAEPATSMPLKFA